MDRGPFSFYDFLGYLFPGVISAFFIYLYIIIINSDYSLDYPKIIDSLSKTLVIFSDRFLINIIVLLIFLYVLGHVVSFLSSCIIEYFSNCLFKYPSFFLLNRVKTSFMYYICNYFCMTDAVIFIWRVVIAILLFPISIVLLLIGHFIRINEYMTRPFDEFTIHNIIIKQKELLNKLNFQEDKLFSEHTDIHSIIMYHVYYNIEDRRRKADNYIALYGFLRSLTLIFCCNTLFLIMIILIKIDINNSDILITSLMFVLSNISFMSFMKIYRRFTKEDYLCLLTCKI